MTAMRLDQLLTEGEATPADLVVSGLTLDSRQVRPGDAFVALAGACHHGIEFAGNAVALGAVVVLAQAPAPAGEPGLAVPVIWIEQLRARLGALAARFYGDPSTAMTVVGVTGTNGKTSAVHLLTQAFAHLGQRAASIGTLGAGRAGKLQPGLRTTPDVLQVHAQLAEFHAAGVRRVAMEVSSHALDQQRIDGVHFAVAVFTNLTRDHLDYHKTMEAYGAAKAKLFAWPDLGAAVINVDDAFGRTLAAATAAHARVLRYASEERDAEIRASAIDTHADGINFQLATPWGSGRVHCGLLGRFNVANLLAVAATLGALDVPFASILDALSALQPVPGRMQRLGGGTQPLVIVDYAHTPDALEQALAAAREHCRGRLTCVFGCGGDRDRGKRPLMGAIAERAADTFVVTDDNPRGEDGDAIVTEIMAGMHAPAHGLIERDRARAIGVAMQNARSGDVVLIAGKGHETYQEVAGVRRPFVDADVVREALEAKPC